MDKKNNLTYSEIIYLFADKSIKERSKFVNYDNHPTDEKISAKPLSYKMVLGALTYLVDKGYISISVKDIKKLLIFPGKDVFGKKLKEAGSDISGIEKVLLNNFKNETEVHKAVYYLLDDDATSPWGQMILISKNSLVEKGYLFIEKERKNIFSAKRYLFVEKDLAKITSEYELVEKNISQFSTKVDANKMIEKAIKNGISSRIEHASNDD